MYGSTARGPKSAGSKPMLTRDIRFETLISIKEQLGFGLRDYLYYKKRCGNDIASLEAIDYRRDAECMIRDVASEKKVRLVHNK